MKQTKRDARLRRARKLRLLMKLVVKYLPVLLP